MNIELPNYITIEEQEFKTDSNFYSGDPLSEFKEYQKAHEDLDRRVMQYCKKNIRE